MKTTIIIVALAVSSFLLFSCKKDEPIKPNFSTKVKTYIEDATNTYFNSIDTFDVSYDVNDRIISIISKKTGSKFLYTYTSNSSYTFDIMKASHLIIREIAFINKDLLIDSSFQYNDTNDSSTHKYLYNSNKQLIQEKFYDYTIAAGAKLFRKNDFTYDSNGNLIKEIESGEFGNTNSITTYLFNNIAASVFTLSTMYFPVQFKNLPISKTILYPSSNTTQTVNITYNFDNNNRITTETQTISQSIKVTKKYFYE